MAEETNIPDEGVKNLTQKSEFIAPAEIGANLYRPIVAPAFDINSLNTRANVDNPALRVKDGTSGSAPYHPKSVQSTESAKFDGIDALFQKTKARISTNVDNNAYSKIYGYDSSPKGAHKARYKAYGQETYDKIGFSPEIDNETWFNANTTMYDDWKRMATQAAWPMMKLGFMAPIHSYGKLLGQADIGQDIAEARDYEEYNAIGYSTKGGVGGFMINLQNSAAYSVGILAESVVEGVLIGAAVGAVGGEGVGAIPGAVIGGVAEGFGSLFKLPGTLLNMSKNLGKMTMNLKKFEKISEVRNLFGNASRSMGNFINPISNTSEAAMKYVFKNPDDLTNLARSARTVGAMWHDVKNMNAALSEGRLEGGFTEQRVYDELYNKYYEKYGEAPSDELQKDMRKQAKVAGYQNTWKNTLLVNYSNNIAFPSIARAGFMKGLPTFSKTVGKDDPIFPEEKIRIYQTRN
jgi:outer membrane lipoprotein SlyB